jgi:acetoacetyl-CoA reductase
MRAALVTGGTGGIGTAICGHLARDGYRVVANHHPEEQAEADAWRTARAEEGLEIDTVAGDVSSFGDAARMATEVERRYGAIDVLVNCAGITRLRRRGQHPRKRRVVHALTGTPGWDTSETRSGAGG